MPRTPKNIAQHELIGLEVEVIAAQNPSQTGIKGKVVDETLKTLVIGTGHGPKIVPKEGSVFRFDLKERVVDIDGSVLLARPEDRIKKRIEKW